MSRYQELFRITENQYLEGSPILIEAGALLKDQKTNQLLIQLKLKNLSEKSIISCKVEIQGYELSGNISGNKLTHNFLDITVSSNESFGDKTPIIIENNLIRKFEVSITEVIFNDGSIWLHNYTKWESLPEQVYLRDYFNNAKLLKQYKIETGSKSHFVPNRYNNLYQCSCGKVNSQEYCLSCNLNFSDLISALNKDALNESLNKRLKKEKQLEEDYKLKQKNIKNNILRVVISISILILIILTITKVIVPNLELRSKYKNAELLLNDGKYDEAISAFYEIENYKDSSEMVKEVQYQKALTLTEEKSIDSNVEALKILEDIKEYKDSSNLEKSISEKIYKEAQSSFDNQDYEKVLNYCGLLNSYKDSNELFDYAEKHIEYDEALLLLKDKKYEEAIEIFNKLEDFENSSKLKDDAVEKLNAQLKTSYQSSVWDSVRTLETFRYVTIVEAKPFLDTVNNDELKSIFPNEFLYGESKVDYYLKITECGEAWFRYGTRDASPLDKSWKIDGDYFVLDNVKYEVRKLSIYYPEAFIFHAVNRSQTDNSNPEVFVLFYWD